MFYYKLTFRHNIITNSASHLHVEMISSILWPTNTYTHAYTQIVSNIYIYNICISKCLSVCVFMCVWVDVRIILWVAILN